MYVITQQQLPDSAYSFNNAASNPYATWDSNTNYSIGTRVTYNNFIYEALQANTNKVPSTEKDFWLLLGRAQPFGLKDNKLSWKTVAATSGTLKITINCSGVAFNAIVIYGHNAVTLKVKCTSQSAGVYYDKVLQPYPADVDNWYQYFFAPYKHKADIAITDLLIYADATIEIELINNSQPPEVGEIIVGLSRYLGDTSLGISAGIIDYSQKKQLPNGEYEIIEKPFSKRVDCELTIDNEFFDSVYNMLAELRAKPAVYIAENSISALNVFGYYRDFSIIYQYPTMSVCRLSIEGLT